MIIHAGMHRTGTSSVQSTLMQLAKHLERHDIYYPILSETGNGYPLAYSIIQNDFSKLDILATEASKNISEHGTILVSAEDFENLLVDTDTAKKFIKYAKKMYNISISWVFTLRDQFEYFESLYNRLSDYEFGNNLVYSQVAREILEHGVFSISGSFEVQKLHFIFDYKPRISRFRNETGRPVHIVGMSDIHEIFSGATLLRLCGLEQRLIIQFKKFIKRDLIRSNESLSLNQVEFNYACIFLDIVPTQSAYDTNRSVFNTIIKTRLKRNHEVRNELKKKFNSKFGKT